METMQNMSKLDDSAFCQTQSYITELSFQFLPSLLIICLCEAYMYMHTNCGSLQYVYM